MLYLLCRWNNTSDIFWLAAVPHFTRLLIFFLRDPKPDELGAAFLWPMFNGVSCYTINRGFCIADSTGFPFFLNSDRRKALIWPIQDDQMKSEAGALRSIHCPRCSMLSDSAKLSKTLSHGHKRWQKQASLLPVDVDHVVRKPDIDVSVLISLHSLLWDSEQSKSKKLLHTNQNPTLVFLGLDGFTIFWI